MDGSLGMRARSLWKGAVGGRGSPGPGTEPAPQADVLAQAVEQATAGGRQPAPTGSAGGGGNAASASDADRALRRELETSLATIFTSAADAIVTVDASHRIVMFNRAAEQLFGCLAGTALGASASRFIDESLLAPDPDRDRRFGETGVGGWRLGEVTPLTARHSDGQTIPIEVTVTPASVRGEQVYTAVIRDASARVRMEEELREVNR